MCGFLVVYNDLKLNLDKKEYVESLKKIRHRGPDKSSNFFSTKIFMGFNRLKILDLSANANQPMSSQNKRYNLVYNGEIYNYLELKKKYFKNYNFKSNGDTELLLKGYEKFGKKFFQKLNGMWAVIIYDKILKKFIVSRDRLGLKPLYFSKIKKTNNSNEYIFSSEQKSILYLLKKNNIKATLNINYAINFLQNGNCDFKNDTFYNEISSVEEGAIYSLNKSFKKHSKIWSLKFKENGESKDLITLKRVFNKTIEQHTIADTKIATTLSRGIDSNLIYALAKKVKKIDAFTLKLENGNNKEYNSMIKNSKKDRINFSTVIVKNKNLKKKFDLFLNFMDEPFVSDNMFYQSYLTENLKRRRYKILLCGDGADEFFFGYEKQYFLFLIHLLKKGDFFNLIKQIKYSNMITFSDFIKKSFKYFTMGHGKRSILIDDYSKNIINADILSKAKNFYKNNKSFLSDFHDETYNRYKLDIIKINKANDISGMMNSIEIRAPFLDHRIIDISQKFSFLDSFQNNKSKSLLRKIFGQELPQSIIKEKKKIKRPSNIVNFVYKVLDKNIRDQIKNKENSKLFSSNLNRIYNQNKKELNMNAAYIWFRFYQINKLISLKALSIKY
tara:strand:- start:8327 stop:10168 length:1842 start_codon:yes stop_codon:yes gene_type:complete